jgi:hypothetical protein
MSRSELVARYKSGYDEVVAALAGITEAELDHRPDEPDGWTAREIVHHLADSELTSAVRLRRLIAEDHPVIFGYDQDTFTQRLHYDRPIAASLAAVNAARDTTAEILEILTEDEWGRQGWHDEIGLYSVDTWLEIYAAHAHDHADQIRRARE